MAYKQKKKKVGSIIFIGFIIVILISTAGIRMVKNNQVKRRLQTSYLEKAERLDSVLKQNQKFAYVTNRDIKAGERIKEEMVLYQEVYSSMADGLFVSQMGEMVAKTDIKKGSQLLKEMVSEEIIDSHIREQEFSVFYLPDNQKPYDVVDVRILYPNGENYIVLSKKILKELDKERGNCFLWLNEQEILLISSAIVDAYLVPGSSLYTTRYIESSLQKPSVVTYTPSEQIIKQIEESPNILEKAKLSLEAEVRKRLETRLEEYEKAHGAQEALEPFSEKAVYSSEDSENAENKDEEELIYVD